MKKQNTIILSVIISLIFMWGIHLLGIYKLSESMLFVITASGILFLILYTYFSTISQLSKMGLPIFPGQPFKEKKK